MTTTTELILAPLAAIGSYALAVKASDAFRYFLKMPTGGVLPSCYGDCMIGQAWGERGCADCPHWAACAAETSNRRAAEVTSEYTYQPDNIYYEDPTTGEIVRAKRYWVSPPTGIDEEAEPLKQRFEIKKTGGSRPDDAYAYFVDGEEVDIVEPLWNKKPCFARELDGELAHIPPNMGGLDSPVPYAGPNYVAPEDLADEMKGLQHFFTEPTEKTGFFDNPNRYDLPLLDRSDLAWDYEFGRVAGDGSIWTAPDERIMSGKVLLHASEMVKASRFGWTYDSDSSKPTYVWAVRA